MISLVNLQKNVNFQNSPPWTLRLHKKNARKQLKIIILSKVSQKEKDKHHIISLVRSDQLLSCVRLFETP